MSILAPITNGRQFEPQLRIPNQRMCGAAALVMAYRRFNIQVDQQALWDQVSHEHLGNRRAHTYDLARDAIHRGLEAIIIQSHQPWSILRTCWHNDIVALVNHRFDKDSGDGHYSILAGIQNDSIKLQDPLLGPDVERSREEFLNLWMPTNGPNEIAGNVLIVIAKSEDQPAIWSHCNRPFADDIECPACRKSIGLKPALALGCWNPKCRQRQWFRLFCPNCDHAIHELNL